jgi:hypothetical protein
MKNQSINHFNLKTILFLGLFLISSSFVNAQIKIDATGHVGLFSSTIPANTDVYLNGRIQFYTGGPVTFKNSFGNYLYIATNSSSPQIYSGSNNNGTVGLSNCGFANMFSYGFTNLSDKRQ